MSRGVAGAAGLLLAAAAGVVHAQAARLPSPTATADSLFRAGDLAAAERAYRAVLQADPANSRAAYQVGALAGEPRKALPWFLRYAALEPDDAWGAIVLGETLSRLGRLVEALRWFDQVERLAPRERDVHRGRARVLARARHTDAAIRTYGGWLADHPDDAEALREYARELFRAGRVRPAMTAWERAVALTPAAGDHAWLDLARAAAAPQAEVSVAGARNSDANEGRRMTLAADARVPRGRVGIRASVGDVRDGVDVLGTTPVAGYATWRPRANVRIETRVGATRLPGIPRTTSEWVGPVGLARVRWAAPGGGASADLRLQRELVSASPVLLVNRVVREEARAVVDLPLPGAWLLRGVGRAAAMVDRFERNTQTGLGAATVMRVAPAAELRLEAHQAGYARPSTAGYYAPRAFQTVQAASYFEVESGAGWLLAADLAAGVQRAAEHGGAFSGWREAVSLWALLDWWATPRARLRVELELTDAALAPTAVATGGAWRYAGVGLGFRWAWR